MLKKLLVSMGVLTLVPFTWAASGDSISINVIGGHNGRAGVSITSDDAGVKPIAAANWNQILSQKAGSFNESITSFTEVKADGTTSTVTSMTLAASGACTYNNAGTHSNANAQLEDGYIDDGGSGATMNFSNIPYGQYTAYIYFGSDGNGAFGPVKVNGTWYAWADGALKALTTNDTSWGSRDSARAANVTLTEGSNYLKFEGLTSPTLTIVGSTSGAPSGTRCGIAGVQLVNTTIPYVRTVAETTSIAPAELTAENAWTLQGTETTAAIPGTSDVGVITIDAAQYIRVNQDATFGELDITNTAASKSTVILMGMGLTADPKPVLTLSTLQTTNANLQTGAGTVLLTDTLTVDGALNVSNGAVTVKKALTATNVMIRSSSSLDISGVAARSNFWFAPVSTTPSTLTLTSTFAEQVAGKVVFTLDDSASGSYALNLTDMTFTVDSTTLEAEKVTYDETAKTVTLDIAALHPVTIFKRPTSSNWTDVKIDYPLTALENVAAGTGFAETSTPSNYYTDNGRTKVLANVASAAENATIYGGYANNSSARTLNADIELKVSSGAFNGIFGAHNNDNWQGAKNTQAGYVLVDMANGSSANYVFGGGYKDGNAPSVTGNIAVVIEEDATVNGSAFGGGFSAHSSTTTYNGNLSLDVYMGTADRPAGSVDKFELDGLVPGYFVAGTAHGINVNGSQPINGSTRLYVGAAEGATSVGTLGKTLVGGNLRTGGVGNEGTSQTISGNSEVIVDLPATASVTGNIIGGSYKTVNGGTSTIAGTSSISLTGGTYTGTITIGSKGSASTTGAATLTLNAGANIMGATLEAGNAASTEVIITSANQILPSTSGITKVTGAIAGDETSMPQVGIAGALGTPTLNHVAVSLGATASATLDALSALTLTNGATVTFGGTLDLGTTRPATLSLPEGVTLLNSGASPVKIQYSATVNDLGAITLPTDLPENVTIEVVSPSGAELTSSVEGGKVTFEAQLGGNMTWHDWEFNGNLTDTGSSPITFGTDGTAAYDNNEALILSPAYPYYTNPGYPTEWTASFYAKTPDAANQFLIGFGTNIGSAIALISGSNNAEVKLVRVSSALTTPTVLATMTVPNATTAYHLYSFVKKEKEVAIYLDSNLWVTYTTSETITFGEGLQIGSIHGGTCSGVARAATTSTARMGMMRLYKETLSAAAIAKLSEEFPYNSPNGTYTRTVADAMADWSATGAWAKSGTEETADVPADGSTIALTAGAATTITMNAGADAEAEAISFTGSDMTLTAGDTASMLTVTGMATIGANVTLDVNAVTLGGPVKMGENCTLTFDASNLDLSTTYVSFTKQLTGLVAAATGSDIAYTEPTTIPAGWTVTFAKNTETNCYELTCTFAGIDTTISGDTAYGDLVWKTGETTLEIVPDVATVPVTIHVEGDATLSNVPETFANVTFVTAQETKPTLTIAPTSSTTFTQYDLGVNLTVPAATTTFGATGSAITVPAGVTLTLDAASDTTWSQAISGAGAFKKTGTGTLTLGANVGATGGNTIAAGTVKFGTGVIPTKEGANDSYSAAGNVTVMGGATLDINGVSDAFLNVVTLDEGATYANTGAAVGNGQRQLKGLTLNGDATVNAGNSFGLLAAGYGVTTLTTNGYTLTKTGNGSFWLAHTTIAGNGVIDVQAGSLNVFYDAMEAGSATLKLNGGSVVAETAVAVGRFTGAGNVTGSGMVTVGSAVESGETFANLTLLSNARVDLVAGQPTLTATNLTLAASASITVNATADHEFTGATEKLIAWTTPTIGDGVTFPASGIYPTGLTLTQLEDGLYLVAPAPTQPDGDTTNYSETAKAELEKFAAAAGLASEFNVAILTKTGDTESVATVATAEAASAVLDCFGDSADATTHLMTADMESNSVTLTYNFGITKMAVNAGDATKVDITVGVLDAEGNVGNIVMNNGATIKLMLGGVEDTASAVTLDAATAEAVITKPISELTGKTISVKIGK